MKKLLTRCFVATLMKQHGEKAIANGYQFVTVLYVYLWIVLTAFCIGYFRLGFVMDRDLLVTIGMLLTGLFALFYYRNFKRSGYCEQVLSELSSCTREQLNRYIWRGWLVIGIGIIPSIFYIAIILILIGKVKLNL